MPRGRPKGSKNTAGVEKIVTPKKERKRREKKVIPGLAASLEDDIFKGASRYEALCLIRDFLAGLGVCGVWKKIHKEILAQEDSLEGILVVKNAWLERARKILS